MPIFASLTRASRLFLVLGGALATVATLAPTAAEENEEEVSFEGKVIRKLLGTGRPDIEYRERSPLVIPPSGTLPPPDTTTASARNPAWPQDPDAKRRRRQADGPAIDAVREQARPLTPDELRQGKTAGRGRSDAPAPTLSDNQMSRPLTPRELGETKSVFSWFSSTPETEQTFTREPTRTRLTEPPSGYRSPAAGQPYAPPKDSGGSWFRPFSLMDRGTSDPK